MLDFHWISHPRAGRCQLRSTESHYYRHWRFFSKSQSWGGMTLGCHWVTVWAPMSYLYHPLCTLTPIHWFWWFIRPSMAKFHLCGCPLLPSSLNLASTCYIYIYYIYIYIQLYSYHFNSFHIYSSGLPNEGSSCCERGGQRLDAQWPLHKAGGGLRFLPLGPGCWAWWFDHVDRLTIGLDRWWSLRE